MKKVFLALSSLFLTSCSLLNISGASSNNDVLSIKVANSKVNLTLSEKQSFDKSSSSLSIQTIPQFEETTYTSLPSQDFLDNEETPYNAGAYINETGGTIMRYLKYTFYLKNTGNNTAKYNLKIKLNDKKESSDGTQRSLDDTLRVMVYENDVNSIESEALSNCDIFAKPAAEYNIDKDGNRTKREFVAQYPYLNEEDDGHPLAISFESTNVVVTYQRNNFVKDQIRRYTLVVWLEGEDPQSECLQEAPVGSSIKLGVDMIGSEN